jgi:hypothetical protein
MVYEEQMCLYIACILSKYAGHTRPSLLNSVFFFIKQGLLTALILIEMILLYNLYAVQGKLLTTLIIFTIFCFVFCM